MVNWAPIADWMGFTYLSQSQGISYAYTLGYRLTDDSQEPWTQQFNRFKANERVAIYGGARLLCGATPGLMQAVGVDMKDSVFVPALSSGETTAKASRAIPLIAKECARLVGAGFELGALQKNAHKKIYNLYTAEERSAELDKAEYKSAKLRAGHVFVFDDFITRGDTLSRIALAVLAANPKAKVYGVALAKTERVAWCPNLTNDQMPAKWSKLWESGEQEARDKAK